MNKDINKRSLLNNWECYDDLIEFKHFFENYIWDNDIEFDKDTFEFSYSGRIGENNFGIFGLDQATDKEIDILWTAFNLWLKKG